MSENKKQTAVEFLYGEMASILNYGVDPVTALKIFDIYKKAKEMEKEQIKSYHIWLLNGTLPPAIASEVAKTSSEKFYKETYGE
jgi:hypothetical protein